MPRRARRKSATGVYHVILRGINRQIIFEDRGDFRTFISVLEHYKYECGFQLFAYCLMNNHIHLLLKENEKDIGEVMKKIEVTFVKWYNQKYERLGNLFQERFKSEPVETEEYLLTVFRYIHQNPLRAGLENKVGTTYSWSSYVEYESGESALVDIGFMMNYFGKQRELLAFLAEDVRDVCMEYYAPRTLSDEESLQVIEQVTGCASPADFQRMELKKRNNQLQKLLLLGFSVRQLSRLTGVSRRALCRIGGQ